MADVTIDEAIATLEALRGTHAVDVFGHVRITTTTISGISQGQTEALRAAYNVLDARHRAHLAHKAELITQGAHRLHIQAESRKAETFRQARDAVWHLYGGNMGERIAHALKPPGCTQLNSCVQCGGTICDFGKRIERV